MKFPVVKRWYRNQIVNAKILVYSSTFLCVIFLIVDYFVDRGLWSFCLAFFPLDIYGVWFLYFARDKYGREILVSKDELQMISWKGSIIKKTAYSSVSEFIEIPGLVTGMRGFPVKELFIFLCLNGSSFPSGFEYRNVCNSKDYWVMMYDKELEDELKRRIEIPIIRIQ